MNAVGDSAFALLEQHRVGNVILTRAAGGFCGELVTDPRPLSEKQADWLEKLLAKAGLPPLPRSEANDG